MNTSMSDFIQEVHTNEQLRNEVNIAGKSITEVEGKQLKRDLATELAKVASRHGYELHVDDFYQHEDQSWLTPES